MKRFIKLFSSTLFVAYIAIILVSNVSCGGDENPGIAEKKAEIARFAYQYRGEPLSDSSASFTKEYLTKILKKPVILDSLVESVVKEENQNFVYLKVKSDSTCKIFAKLKCSSELADKIETGRKTNLLFAASINRIDIGESRFGLSSGNDDLPMLTFGSEIHLSGNCLDMKELSAY